MSKALVESTVSIAEEEKETSNDCGIWDGIKFKSKPVLETVVKFILICNKNYNDFPTIELLNLVFDTNHFDDDEELEKDAVFQRKSKLTDNLPRSRKRKVSN